MSKVLIFSDLHIHNYSAFDVAGSRLKNCLKVLSLVFKVAEMNGVSTVLFPGDLYNVQGTLPTEVVNETLARLKKLFAKYPHIKLLAISGNHDHATKNLIKKPAISALTHLAAQFPDNFLLLDDAMTPVGDKHLVYGIPYYEYPEDFQIRLQEAHDLAILHGDKEIILMIHQTPSHLGGYPIPPDTQITDELYAPFNYVMCGHIHGHQMLTDKFMVVGSPLHKDKGDMGIEKGLIMLDLETYEHEFLSTRDVFPEFIQVKDGEEIPAGAELEYYVVREPDMSQVEGAAEAKAEDFNSGLSPHQLIENYWNEVDGKDKKLLQTGLSVIK